MSYEGGLLIALILWFFSVVRSIIIINSQMEKNLATIGKRSSFLGGMIDIDYRKSSKKRTVIKFLIIHMLGFVFIIFSWIYVFFALGTYVYIFYKDIGAPVAVKEFRWKLKNLDMTLDEIIRELMIVSGQDLSNFENVKADIVNDLKYKKTQY